MNRKKAQMVRRTHIFSRDEYVCSFCGYSANKPFKVCPRCSRQMKGPKTDPFWVDELEAGDALFDD